MLATTALASAIPADGGGIVAAALLPGPDVAVLHGELPVWLQVLAVLLGSLVVAKGIETAGYWIAEARIEESSIRTAFFEEVTRPLYLTVFLYGVIVAVRIVDLGIELDAVENLVATVILILWSHAGIRFGGRALDLLKDRERSYEFAPIFKNLWSVFVLAVAAVGILVVWEIDITPLLASAGVLGIILGFAARDAVANFIGGIALYFDNTYKLGDFIVLETGEKGTVVDIGLRSTTLLTRDQVTIAIPNSVLNNAHIVNESAPQRYKRIRLPVQVTYGVDADRVEEILLEEAAATPEVNETPKPDVRLTEFASDGINYELRVFIASPTREPYVRHLVNTAIYKRFAAEGIEIPFPQRDVHLRDDGDDSQPLGADIRDGTGIGSDIRDDTDAGGDPEA